MNPVDAIRLMVRHVDGGWDAMGVLCGKAGETLRHAFSGKHPTYVPSVIDACTISEACIRQGSQHAHAFANAIAAASGGFVQLEGPGADHTLMSATVALVQGSGQVLSAVTAARADGIVSDNERKQIERDANQVIETMQALLVQVAKENEAARPAGLRQV